MVLNSKIIKYDSIIFRNFNTKCIYQYLRDIDTLSSCIYNASIGCLC